MWSPGYSFLFFFLILELTPRPGVPQEAHTFKYCQDCKKILKETDVTQKFYQNLIKNANYTTCPNNIIRFKAPKGIFCGTRIQLWVDNVTNCIDQGRSHCLGLSGNQQDFSKGSNMKPPTTTQKSITSTANIDASLKLSTQTWKGGTLQPPETTTEELGRTQRAQETTIGLTTRAPDLHQNNDLLHGNEPPTKEDDDKGKMKNMTIAIISLLLIVLLMTAVGVYVWCRGPRPRFNVCRRHCTDETINYQPAPLNDIVP